MKNYLMFLVCCMSFLFGTKSVFAQNKLGEIGNKEIIGLHLDAETREQLRKVKNPVFSIGEDGLLRPSKGYNIYHLADRKIVVITNKTKKDFLQASKDSRLTVGNVTLRCSSDADECSVCMVDLQAGEYYCRAENCKDCQMTATITEGKVNSAAVKQ